MNSVKQLSSKVNSERDKSYLPNVFSALSMFSAFQSISNPCINSLSIISFVNNIII